MSPTARSVPLTTGLQICLNQSSVEVWGCWIPIRNGVPVSGNQSLGQGHGGAEEGAPGVCTFAACVCMGVETRELPMGGQRLMGDALLRPAKWVVRSRWRG